jgi:hypothetical protein
MTGVVHRSIMSCTLPLAPLSRLYLKTPLPVTAGVFARQIKHLRVTRCLLPMLLAKQAGVTARDAVVAAFRAVKATPPASPL